MLDNVLARARPFVLRSGLHLLVGRDIRELKEIQKLILRALSNWNKALLRRINYYQLSMHCCVLLELNQAAIITIKGWWI